MNRLTIPCTVEGDTITHPDIAAGAAGGHDAARLELTFGPSWRDTTRQLLWGDALREHYVITTLTLDLLAPGSLDTYEVPVPPEAMAVEGCFSLTIRGAVVANGVETAATVTQEALFRVLPSRWNEFAAERADVTPSQAVQLQNEINALRADIANASTLSFAINAQGHLIVTKP